MNGLDNRPTVKNRKSSQNICALNADTNAPIVSLHRLEGPQAPAYARRRFAGWRLNIDEVVGSLNAKMSQENQR